MRIIHITGAVLLYIITKIIKWTSIFNGGWKEYIINRGRSTRQILDKV